MIKKFGISFLLLASFSSTSHSADYWVEGEVSSLEFYGAQVSVFLSGEVISANACGLTDRFAISPSTHAEPLYGIFYSLLLSSYAAKKTLRLRVSDSVCSGDRTTISYVRAK